MNDRFKLRWPLLKDRTNRFIKFVYGDCFIGKPFDPPTKHFGEPQQCTGLNDKNGRLIFENDYIENDNTKDDVYLVVFDEKTARFMAKETNGNLRLINKNVRVVGNIHE